MGEATDVRVLAAASEGGRSNTSGLQLKENLPVKRAATLNCVVLSRYKICRSEMALEDAPPQAGVLEGRARLHARKGAGHVKQRYRLVTLVDETAPRGKELPSMDERGR